ncbi:Extradiol ring-cleavage dioxygenase, class III enzyme, subunit B [Aspergillus unguis]
MLLSEESASADYWKKCGDEALAASRALSLWRQDRSCHESDARKEPVAFVNPSKYKDYELVLNLATGERCIQMVAAEGFHVSGNTTFDWIHDVCPVLIRMFPAGCPPTTIISMNARFDPHFQMKIGSVLRPLRYENYFLIVTGGATHNLYRNWWAPMLRFRDNFAMETTPEDWALEFRQVVEDVLLKMPGPNLQREMTKLMKHPKTPTLTTLRKPPISHKPDHKPDPSMAPSTYPENDLRKLSRFITTHDAKAKAVFHRGQPEDMPIQILETSDYTFSLAYATNRFPARLQDDEDVNTYSDYLKSPPGLVSMSGTVCRIVDLAPNVRCAMHRTVSLDYGVVLEGEIELILDSGETRILKRGDVAVQRGTNHAWRNVTPGSEADAEDKGRWARILFFLSPAEPLKLEGAVLGEVTAGIDVKESS